MLVLSWNMSLGEYVSDSLIEYLLYHKEVPEFGNIY